MRGDEPSSLHRVDDELQFRQLQPSVPDEVLVLAASVADDVPAALLEIPDICHHRFPVGVDALGFQVGEKLGDDGWMALIRVVPEVTKDDERAGFIQRIEPPFKSCFSPIADKEIKSFSLTYECCAKSRLALQRMIVKRAYWISQFVSPLLFHHGLNSFALFICEIRLINSSLPQIEYCF